MSTQKQGQWRRAKVLEMSSQGYSQIEISTQLQVDDSTICKDVAHLTAGPRQSSKAHPRSKVIGPDWTRLENEIRSC
jgi:hypothetical protein